MSASCVTSLSKACNNNAEKLLESRFAKNRSWTSAVAAHSDVTLACFAEVSRHSLEDLGHMFTEALDE